MAVLAVAAIVLAVIALDRVRAPQTSARPDPATTFSFGAAPTSSPTPTSSEASGPSYPRSEERFLSVGSGGMWRGSAGECGGAPPLIERSVDGGETWENVTPTYRGIGQLLSLDSFAGTEAEAIARVGAGCETQALRTFTQGEFWEPYPEVLEAARYLDPAAPSRLITPQGPVEAPCPDPRSYRSSSSVVALVCESTPFVLTGDDEWAPLPVTGAVALAISGDRVIVAGRSAGCDGLAMTAMTDANFQRAAPLGCVAVAPNQPTAVAAAPTGVLVWSGDEIVSLS